MTDVSRDKKDKSTWPSGPWQTEPDEKRWTDEATGLPCVVMRGPVGAWCGYVGVPPSHVAYDVHYYRSEMPLEDVLKGDAERKARIQLKVNDIEVHGGLTFSGVNEHRGAGFYWFGFDCAHAGDFSPRCDNIETLGEPTGWGSTNDYRDLVYVMEQTTLLAKQLAAITDIPILEE